MRGNVPVVNGRPRRSLTEEIDRLEAILDGLADALNGAVAEAVKDAVGGAAREALTAFVPGRPTPDVSWGGSGAAAWLTAAATRAVTWLASVLGLTAAVVARNPRVGLAAAGAGLAVAVVGWAAPAGLAAAAAGGAVAVLVVTAAGRPQACAASPADFAEQLGHRQPQGGGQSFDVQ